MTSIRAAIVPVTPFEQNCTLVWCTATGEGVIVSTPAGDVERIEAAIDQVKMTPTAIWLTQPRRPRRRRGRHRGEPDTAVIGPHVRRSRLARADPGHRREVRHPRSEAVTRGPLSRRGRDADRGARDLRRAALPGPFRRKVVFVNAEERFALVGDVVFRGSIGRTDFPGGDHATLIASIRDKLFPLGDDLAFVCGHGPGSTIGHERAIQSVPALSPLSPRALLRAARATRIATASSSAPSLTILRSGVIPGARRSPHPPTTRRCARPRAARRRSRTSAGAVTSTTRQRKRRRASSTTPRDTLAITVRPASSASTTLAVRRRRDHARPTTGRKRTGRRASANA